MRASNSAIRTFKACRRKYQLEYIYGFRPIEHSEAVERGLSYHECIACLLSGNEYQADSPKIAGMVKAFETYILPEIPKADAVEKWFNYETASGHKMIGRVDGATNSGIVIEHKTTSGLIDASYFQRLDFDEQIPTYLIGMKAKEVLYTVCSTPTIRQKKNETDEEFAQRCFEWYDGGDQSKITFVNIVVSEEKLDEFSKEQDAILTEMENCNLFYRNPDHCMKWGRLCEYASICDHCDPSLDYIEFERVRKS